MQTEREPELETSNGWTMLSVPNRRLTAMAQQVTTLARPLLPQGRRLFLGIELDAEGELKLIWWRQRDYSEAARISAGPEGFCDIDTEEGAIQDAAYELLAYLAGRWPTPPAALGVITDGTGMAFAPADPVISTPGWLLRRVQDGSALLAILPLDPSGPCALLGNAAPTPARH
jgi:hypothetical protein